MTTLTEPNPGFCPCVNWGTGNLLPAHHPDCDGHGFRLCKYPGHVSAVFDELSVPSLSLLIIDLGNCCVVKVESGELPDALQGWCWLPFWESEQAKKVLPTTGAITASFDQLKATLDGDKPLPRLERDKKGDLRLHIFKQWQGDELQIVSGDYDALSQLAGHPLPIYEPKEGKWEQLGTLPEIVPIPDLHPNQRISSFSDVLGFVTAFPFKAWRYTRP